MADAPKTSECLRCAQDFLILRNDVAFYHHRFVVDEEAAIPHRYIEVAGRRPAGGGASREQKIAVKGASFHPKGPALVVHAERGPARLGLQSPAKMRDGIGIRIVEVLEVLAQIFGVESA